MKILSEYPSGAAEPGSSGWTMETGLIGLVVACSLFVLLQSTSAGAEFLSRCLNRVFVP